MKTTSPVNISQMIAQLYQEHHLWLYQWLQRKLDSPNHAEDILQDTFIKIMKSQELFQLKEPRAFLCTTAKRLIIDQARKQKIEQSYLHYLAHVEHEYTYATPEDILMVIESLDRIAQALNQLEERPRQILLMHYLDGMSQTAIATQLQLSTKTIQRDLMKALIYCHHIAVT